MSTTIIDQIKKVAALQNEAAKNVNMLAQSSINNGNFLISTNVTLKEVIETIKKMVDLMGLATHSTINNLDALTNLTKSIVKKLVFLYRLLGYVIFVLTMLTWHVFLQEPFNLFLSSFVKWWPKLSEAWQIFIVGIPVAIIIGIIINVTTKKFVK